MEQLKISGEMRMAMSDKIAALRRRVDQLKSKRGINTRIQIFRFKPFSKKQKKVLTLWMPDSPVRDYDGIIADGAIRSGKTVSMSLAELCHVWKDYRIFPEKCSFLAEADAPEPRVSGD